jgi:uncharacterized membrane protein
VDAYRKVRIIIMMIMMMIIIIIIIIMQCKIYGFRGGEHKDSLLG